MSEGVGESETSPPCTRTRTRTRTRTPHLCDNGHDGDGVCPAALWWRGALDGRPRALACRVELRPKVKRSARVRVHRHVGNVWALGQGGRGNGGEQARKRVRGKEKATGAPVRNAKSKAALHTHTHTHYTHSHKYTLTCTHLQGKE